MFLNMFCAFIIIVYFTVYAKILARVCCRHCYDTKQVVLFLTN